MKDEKLRKALDKFGEENDITFKMFENPSFDESIVGISNDNRLIYDYDKMIAEFAFDNTCDYEEAEEFIQYNTMRTLPYFGSEAPIVIEYKIDDIKNYYSDEYEDYYDRED